MALQEIGRYEGRPGTVLLAVGALIAVSTCLPARAAGQESPELSPLGWMAGCWAGTLSSGVRYEEWWMPDAGGVMLGMARMVRDGRTVSFESMRIILDGGTPVYVAQPGGGTATTFRMTQRQDGRTVFENPEHDFPQAVIYSEPVTGAPFARIEGRRGGELRGLDFPLSRVSCSGDSRPGPLGLAPRGFGHAVGTAEGATVAGRPTSELFRWAEHEVLKVVAGRTRRTAGIRLDHGAPRRTGGLDRTR